MVNIGPTLPIVTPLSRKTRATTATVVVSKQTQKVPEGDRRKHRDRRNGRHKALLESRAGRDRRRSVALSIDTSA